MQIKRQEHPPVIRTSFPLLRGSPCAHEQAFACLQLDCSRSSLVSFVLVLVPLSYKHTRARAHIKGTQEKRERPRWSCGRRSWVVMSYDSPFLFHTGQVGNACTTGGELSHQTLETRCFASSAIRNAQYSWASRSLMRRLTSASVQLSLERLTVGLRMETSLRMKSS